MQTAPASDIQPAVALLEKTPFPYETLLRDLPADLLLYGAHAFHAYSGPFQKYSHPKP
jgi:hypothetical protein